MQTRNDEHAAETARRTIASSARSWAPWRRNERRQHDGAREEPGSDGRPVRRVRASWSASVAGLALVAAGLYACGTTGEVETTGDFNLPFVHVGWNSNSQYFDVTSNQPHTCVTLTWFDATGASVGEVNLETDSGGSTSGNVPNGAVSWALTVVRCPEDALVASPLASLAQADHLFWGAPLVPSDEPGAENLVYSLRIRAHNHAEAMALRDSVLRGGVGCHVPTSVEVLTFATLTPDPDGARLLQAQPGTFEAWSLDFNDGAFAADLESANRYAVGEWDVVETLVPSSALDYGIVPGQTYSNTGSTRFKTNRMTAAGSALYRFTYTN